MGGSDKSMISSSLNFLMSASQQDIKYYTQNLFNTLCIESRQLCSNECLMSFIDKCIEIYDENHNNIYKQISTTKSLWKITRTFRIYKTSPHVTWKTKIIEDV